MNNNIKNKEVRKDVLILKTCIYTCIGILFLNYGAYFILNVINHLDFGGYFENFCNPLGVFFFGLTALLMTILNPKISPTNEVKGDKLMFGIGIILMIGGIVYLIYNLIN